MSDTQDEMPISRLQREDLEFIQRLVLASGSLKELASDYGVSYPTIRVRLDKLIARLRNLIDGKPPDPMADLLADLITRGEIAASAAHSLLKLHRALLQNRKGEHSHD